jgi:hypothetical protein
MAATAMDSSVAAANEPIIVKEGWLRKKGSRANLWSERYFVLRGPSLFYFIKSDNVVRLWLLWEL